MNRKILRIVTLMGMLWVPAHVQALEDRPAWKIMAEALAYLHSIPEVAWVKFHEHEPKVFISWKSQPRNFGRINKTAALRAAQALHNEVTVYALPPGETLPPELYFYEPTFLCKTVANPHEIVQSNCR